MIRLAVRVQAERAELVLAELLELAPGGVEEVAPEAGVVEYAVYGPPGELPSLPALQAAAGGALVEVLTHEVADDWAQRWRTFHRPLVLGERLTVRPPWEPAGRTPLDVVIDPGQAFGTGAHATTRLCLELLLGLPAHGPFLDLGSGSGVLAIVAAKLGYSPVCAVDNDPVAVEVTLGNAAANRVRVPARTLDIREVSPPASQTVAANLLRPLLVHWASELERAAGPRPQRVLASGILNEEAAEVTDAFSRAGFHAAAQRERAGWTALLLEGSVP